ncbi:MAG: 50S ribosomal protein L10 [Deferribacteraceae bacterium]|nr:50S ribosomal protein L10 [Deferribacteraceae bacterium]
MKKKEQKIEEAKGLAQEFNTAEGVILAAYQGLTFSQQDTVRRSVKSAGNDFKVVKNTLLKKAFAESGISGLDEYLAKSTALLLVRKDFAAAAKTITKYARDFAPLAVKAGYLDGRLLNAKEVAVISELPSREALLANGLSTKTAPAQNFVSVLSNIPRGLLNVLKAVGEKQAAAEAAL